MYLLTAAFYRSTSSVPLLERGVWLGILRTTWMNFQVRMATQEPCCRMYGIKSTSRESEQQKLIKQISKQIRNIPKFSKKQSTDYRDLKKYILDFRIQKFPVNNWISYAHITKESWRFSYPHLVFYYQIFRLWNGENIYLAVKVNTSANFETDFRLPFWTSVNGTDSHPSRIMKKSYLIYLGWCNPLLPAFGFRGTGYTVPD